MLRICGTLAHNMGLVNNLCTVWIGRHRIHANVARKDKGVIDTSNSYAHVVKGGLPVNGELQQASTDFITDGRVTWVELEGKAYWVRAKEILGWVPDFVEQDNKESDFDDEHSERELNGDILRSNKDLEGDNEKDVIPDTVFEDNLPKFHDGEASVGQNEVQSEDPFNIYTLLNKKKENNEKISVTHDSLKYPPGFTPKDVETNVEQSKKRNGYVREEKGTKLVCSGQFKKSKTPRSGRSTLSLMDELVKVGQTMGYNMDGGTWVTNGKSFLIITVYSPQELTEKKLLWDYLCHVIANWKGEVIVMGDFNEVRTKNERFGSVFNVQGADAFNSFISSAGLEVFLLGVDGFEKLVNETWFESPVDMSNAMLNLMKKSKYLKKKIHAWNNDMRKYSKNSKLTFKAELENLDLIINKGEGNDDIINKRMAVVKSIQELDKLQSMDAAQKAKIKWAIEGDENSKYYHGILNKKRHQLSIRGVLENGTWIDNPVLVKNKFLSHFKNMFERPKEADMEFPYKLTCVQQSDLEIDVSNDEIKRALIENDVVAAVKYFFQIGSIPKGCNSSFIALISKIRDAKMVKDFWPISLIGSLYKIIAKILANRIVVVLGDIVNEKFKKRSHIYMAWNCPEDGGFQEARLYALESHKRIDVAAKLAHSSVAYSFRRAPRSGEEQSKLADLLTTIEGVSLVSMNDRWVWSLECLGNFSVALVRKLIDDRRLPDVSSKTRWIKAVPIKVNVHAWKVRLDSLPTRLNISRREHNGKDKVIKLVVQRLQDNAQDGKRRNKEEKIKLQVLTMF
uniref:RNA-directed DNA polymerase, eukaryota, reverse transcriptase zinc-binding domain protein n=1 Tax=Tanacetum cinerariifolium TaxID=118510 RepID=A0A6L2NLC0_TANCI|nr:RNA-directed DNA polymerase, eukaryota, reverse transcriptase zinc-binding domain protein [Tanacetum cinerariifolium]